MPFPLLLLALAGGGATAVSITAKKGIQRQFDREADRVRRVKEIDVGLGEASAQNMFDEEQLAAMAVQLQDAQNNLMSKDPQLRALGASRIMSLDQALRGSIQQNETEARSELIRQMDAEIAAAGVTRSANERRFQRELAMNNQVLEDLKQFRQAERSFNKVMGLLDNNDQLASLAGLTAFVQSIDDSIVKESELLKYQGANGLITQLSNILKKTEGQDFDPATKQSVKNAVAALFNAEKTVAFSLMNMHQARAVGFALRPERVMAGVDDSMFTPIVIDREAQQRLEAEADQFEAEQKARQDAIPSFADIAKPGLISRGMEAFGLQRPSLSKAIAIGADKALQAWQQTGRNITGASLHVDPETGQIWERDANGKWTKISGTQDQRRQAEIFRIRSSTVKLTRSQQQRLEALEAEEKQARRDARPPGLFQKGGFFDQDNEQ